MSLGIGSVISRNPYKTSVTLSDYGNAVFDNGTAPVTTASDSEVSCALEYLKMIQESLTSLGIESAITTYYNGSFSNKGNWCVCINFIVSGCEFQYSINPWSSSILHDYICFRQNATSCTIRPQVPSTANIRYEVYGSLNADLCCWHDALSIIFSNATIKVQVITYNKVVYIVVYKSNSANDNQLIICGELGVGINVESYAALNCPYYGSPAAICYDGITGVWGSNTLWPVMSGKTSNTLLKILACPITLTTPQANSEASNSHIGLLPVDPKYILASSRINTQLGAKYANGRWINVYGSILIPWDGVSTSVFD